MSDLVLRTGDFIKITLPPPLLIPVLQSPTPLRGSSANVSINGLLACLEGDEIPELIRGPLAYTAPPYTVPGTGSVSVRLMPENVARQTKNGKCLLLKGQSFPITFSVRTPALQPTPAGPVPDPVLVKQGTGQFLTSNTTVYAG